MVTRSLQEKCDAIRSRSTLVTDTNCVYWLVRIYWEMRFSPTTTFKRNRLIHSSVIVGVWLKLYVNYIDRGKVTLADTLVQNEYFRQDIAESRAWITASAAT